MISSANIEGEFRYSLYRGWDTRLPTVCWVMLNPSTANETEDDHTIRKCVAFSEIYGFGQMVVVNLFAFRTKSPGVLKRHGYPVGPENDRHIRMASVSSQMVIAAWGAHGRGLQRARDVVGLLSSCKSIKALKILHGGVPGHPLMLSYKRELVDLPTVMYR